PDKAHAVRIISRYTFNPDREHWNALKWVLRYLRGTSSLILSFGSDDPFLLGYADSDMAVDVDDRKSTSREAKAARRLGHTHNKQQSCITGRDQTKGKTDQHSWKKTPGSRVIRDRIKLIFGLNKSQHVGRQQHHGFQSINTKAWGVETHGINLEEQKVTVKGNVQPDARAPAAAESKKQLLQFKFKRVRC
ncbi:Retrovirus-related Pol polyprotein from transposon TNT 1-94-like protein, partial [Drosera capensis]